MLDLYKKNQITPTPNSSISRGSIGGFFTPDSKPKLSFINTSSLFSRDILHSVDKGSNMGVLNASINRMEYSENIEQRLLPELPNEVRSSGFKTPSMGEIDDGESVNAGYTPNNIPRSANSATPSTASKPGSAVSVGTVPAFLKVETVTTRAKVKETSDKAWSTELNKTPLKSKKVDVVDTMLDKYTPPVEMVGDPEAIVEPTFNWFESSIANFVFLYFPLFTFLPLLFIYMLQRANFHKLLWYRMKESKLAFFRLINIIISLVTFFLDGVFYFFIVQQWSANSLGSFYSPMLLVVSFFILYMSSIFSATLSLPIERIWLEAVNSYIGRAESISEKKAGLDVKETELSESYKIDDLDTWDEFKKKPLYLYTDYARVEYLNFSFLVPMIFHLICPIFPILRLYFTTIAFELQCMSTADRPILTPGSNSLALPNLTLTNLSRLLPYHYYGGILMGLFIEASHLVILVLLGFYYLFVKGYFSVAFDSSTYYFSISSYTVVFLVVKTGWALFVVIYFLLLELPARRHYFSVYLNWLNKIQFDYSTPPSVIAKWREEQSFIRLQKKALSKNKK